MTGASKQVKIDPRGPRFGAGITSVVLIIALWLGLTDGAPAGALTASFWVMVYAVAMFVWGVVAGPAKHPYGLLFRVLIRPRLGAPSFLEPEAPPRFAQGVGLVVTGVGVLLHLLTVPYALVVAAGAAFVAAFLNAVFGLCLGCELYGLLLRLGLVGKKTPKADSSTPQP